jgi:hypothetical protein
VKGGARPGAGRKATGRARPIKQIITLSEREQALILPACAKGETISAFMRRVSIAEAERVGAGVPEPDEHPPDF